jgi:hypothetical protein
MSVLTRMRKSLWPYCTKDGIFRDAESADLYGPFWIMITLVVQIAIIGYINHQVDQQTLEIEMANAHSKLPIARSQAYYSLQKVARSSFVIFFYFIAMPLFELLILKYVLVIEFVSYIWLFGVYGYSFTVFVITLPLNIIPQEWLRWTFLSASALISLCVISAELTREFGKEVKGANLFKFIIFLCFLAATHGVLVLSFKKYFLN